MQVNCKIISLENCSKKDGMMFIDNSITFNKLVSWVERNCPNTNEIRIQNNQIIALYDERAEIYYLKD